MKTQDTTDYSSIMTVNPIIPTTYGEHKLSLDDSFKTHNFIQRATLKHKNKYLYNKSIFTDYSVKVTITCPDHGDFYQLYSTHITDGKGCPDCTGVSSTNYSCPFKKNTKEAFVYKVSEVHKGKYTYCNANYVDRRTKLMVTCPAHGDFSITPEHHQRGYGCTKCISCPSCFLYKTNGDLCEICKPAEDNKVYQKMYVKSKEYAALNYIKQNLPDEPFIHNKSVGSDCSGGHLFPDLRFKRPGHNVIIEIDEHQHRGASYSCDERRMVDIVNQIGLPTVFIRFNPDGEGASHDTMLKYLVHYLNIDPFEDNLWNEYRLKVEYLFYKNRD